MDAPATRFYVPTVMQGLELAIFNPYGRTIVTATAIQSNLSKATFWSRIGSTKRQRWIIVQVLLVFRAGVTLQSSM